jgi:hypothetical protein
MSDKTTLDEPDPIPGHSTKIDAQSIDRRLPEGEILVEVWADGQVHLAFREQPHHGWPSGAWTVLRGSFQ